MESRVGDVSEEILGLEIERERIGEDAVQRSGDCLGGVGLEIGRRLQRRVGRGHRDAPLADMWIVAVTVRTHIGRSEEHTSELQSLMRISYAVFCLKKKTINKHKNHIISTK